MINNPPITANSIVGFDIEKYIKGDIKDNRAPEISAPAQLNNGPKQDSVELKNKKEENAPTNGWKVFGGVFITALVALMSTPFIKKAIQSLKK